MLMLITLTAEAQSVACKDLHLLEQRYEKKEFGSPAWLKTIDSVINVCPSSASLWGDKAMAYMIRGEFVEGMKYLDKAAELDPFYYLGNRAWYKMRYAHDYKGAIDDLTALEKVAGGSMVYVTNMHMYMVKGLAYKQMGDHQKALELYNFAINEQITHKGPTWVGSYDYLTRGILKYQMDDIDGAIEDLTLQVKEYESLADTYYWRGLAYAKVGRKDEARLDLQQAKDIILSNGNRRWDNLVTLPDEVYLSQVESALLRLY